MYNLAANLHRLPAMACFLSVPFSSWKISDLEIDESVIDFCIQLSATKGRSRVFEAAVVRQVCSTAIAILLHNSLSVLHSIDSWEERKKFTQEPPPMILAEWISTFLICKQAADEAGSIIIYDFDNPESEQAHLQAAGLLKYLENKPLRLS